MTRRIRLGAVLCGLVLWLGLSAQAQAQDKKRVVVVSFQGPSSGPVRNHVVNALKARDEVEVVPASVLGGARQGSALREAAREAQVSAIVEGRVVKKGKLLKVTVSVRDTERGEVVKEESWSKKKPQLVSIRPAVWGALGSSVMSTSPPEKAETPAPVERTREPEPRAERSPARTEERAEARVSRSVASDEEPDEDETPEKRVRGNPQHPALVLSFGPRMMWRSLEYGGATELNTYSSYAKNDGSPAFNLALHAQWFPGAHKRADWLSDLGLEVDLDYSLLLKSKQGTREIDTTAYEVGVGAMYRIPLDAFEPQVRVGYVKHTFEADVPAGTLLPGVSYSALRFGVGSLVNVVEMFNFDVSFGYLLVLGSGDVGSSRYASDLSTWAWEIGAGATVRFKQVYGVRAAVDYRRYKLDFGSDNNAAVVLPKDGSDDYLRTTLSFVYTLPGR